MLPIRNMPLGVHSWFSVGTPGSSSMYDRFHHTSHCTQITLPISRQTQRDKLLASDNDHRHAVRKEAGWGGGCRKVGRDERGGKGGRGGERGGSGGVFVDQSSVTLLLISL